MLPAVRVLAFVFPDSSRSRPAPSGRLRSDGASGTGIALDHRSGLATISVQRSIPCVYSS